MSETLAWGLGNMTGAFNNLGQNRQAMGPLASLGISAGGSLINNLANIGQAKKARQFQLDMWNKNNAYNHPSAQMERLRQANLNPNLMYGQGNVGNSNAPVKDPGRPNIDAGAMDMIGAYQNAKMQEVQTDNLRAMNTKIMQDTALSNAQTLKALADTKGKNLNNNVLQETMDTILKKINDEAYIVGAKASDAFNRVQRNYRTPEQLEALRASDYSADLNRNAMEGKKLDAYDALNVLRKLEGMSKEKQLKYLEGKEFLTIMSQLSKIFN